MKKRISLMPFVLFALGSCLFCSNLVSAQNAGKEALLNRLSDEIGASDKINDKIKNFAQDKLLRELTNPVFVQEIKKQNEKKISIEDIIKIDAQWIKEGGEIPLHEELMNNACAKEASSLYNKYPLVELFVMDNKGANVGQANETSDYWQGDEAKWKNSFNGGKGGVDIGKRNIDESTGLADQKISLPVIDEDGTVIGAVCFGLDITHVDLKE